MPDLILVLMLLLMILALMVWRSVLRVLNPRASRGESAAPHAHYNNALQPGFRILERARLGGIAENGFDAGWDDIRLADRRRRAEVYLLRVVALTGAAQTDDGYSVEVGRTRFHVRDRFVRRLRDSTNPQSGYDETCFYCAHKSMPRAEEIASALLLLKSNPLLFDKWARQNGLAFKPDGQVFTRAQ